MSHPPVPILVAAEAPKDVITLLTPNTTFGLQSEIRIGGFHWERSPTFWRWQRLRGHRVFPRSRPRWRGIQDLLLRQRSLKVIDEAELLSIHIVPPGTASR